MLQLNKPTYGRDHRAANLECRLLIQNTQSDVLLMRGHQGNGDGEWTLPGGGVQGGESLAIAAVRCAHEVLGILVWPTCIVSVWDSALGKAHCENRISFTYAVAVLSGCISAEEDTEQAKIRWCSRSALPSSLSSLAAEALKSRGAINSNPR